MAKKEEVLKYVVNKADPMIGFVPIYEIVLFKELQELKNNDNIGMGMADCSNFNSMGFYYELDDAINAMHENRCDIRETVFDYGFVLVHWPGVYNNSSGKLERLFYKWDETLEGFYETEEPSLFEYLAL